MNRRRFLGSMLAGAAAVVGLAAVAPKAEASPTSPESEARDRVIAHNIISRRPDGVVTLNGHVMDDYVAGFPSYEITPEILGYEPPLVEEPGVSESPEFDSSEPEVIFGQEDFSYRAGETDSGNPETPDDTDLVMGYINCGEVIPPGEYRVNETIHTDRSVIGSGPDKTFLRFPPTVSPLLRATAGAGQQIRGLSLIRLGDAGEDRLMISGNTFLA